MQALEMNNCEICYCNYMLTHEDNSRPEGICYGCWHQHVTTALTQISYRVGSNIISPFEGKDTIDVCQALNSLHKDHAQQLEEWLFKKYAAFTVDIEKCPSEGCDYIFTAEKCVWEHSDEKCPKCETELAPSPTLDFKTLIGYVYFLFLTSKCPKCEIPIEKTTGCPHMSCPCGHEFCWYCLKDYFSSGNNLYSVHETKECAFIFFSKMAFISVCLLGVVLSFLGNQAFQLCIKLFFTGAGYVLHTLLLGLVTLINITVINQINTRRWQNYHSPNYLSTNFLIVTLIMINALTLGILWYFELFMISAIIMLATLGLVGVAALSVWLIVYSCETWFDYII